MRVLAQRRPVFTKEQCVSMPSYGKYHDTPCAGHSGQRLTRTLVEEKYYWLKIRDDINQYVLTRLCSESTGKSPFEVAICRLPLKPYTLLICDEKSSIAAGSLADSWRQ
ncbi:hypothetical protein V2J09_004225 [Rumex salicifolius]